MHDPSYTCRSQFGVKFYLVFSGPEMRLIEKTASAKLRLPALLVTFVASSVFSHSTFAEGFDVEAAYNQSCAVCHNSGAAGAPRKGDQGAWTKRLAQGEDKLLANVKNGVGAMPAKGLCSDCSDDQFRELIRYMSK